MFLKGLKNMEIAWLDGDYVVWYGRIYSYPDELASLLLKHAIASIPVPSDYIEEVQFWAESVSPKLSKKEILQTVKSTFGLDLFAKVGI